MLNHFNSRIGFGNFGGGEAGRKPGDMFRERKEGSGGVLRVCREMGVKVKRKILEKRIKGGEWRCVLGRERGEGREVGIVGMWTVLGKGVGGQ